MYNVSVPRPEAGQLSWNKQEIAGSNVFKAADGTLSSASVVKVLMIGEAVIYRELRI